jgi:phospholipid/cholesterol/gamma-HCH transport system ATP-binding protein
MHNRVAMASALITEPEVVLFDEPTTGLDPVRKNTVYEMISRYQDSFGFTAIMVSHDIPDVLCISNSLAILDKGRFQFSGSPQELRDTQTPIEENSAEFGLQNPFKSKIMAFLA